MLKDTNPYAKHGRHDRRNQRHEQGRYHLREGMAKVALATKVTGKTAVDAVGRPLLYSNEMAERHSAGQLESWARGARVVGGFSGMDFCTQCHRVPHACRCR